MKVLGSTTLVLGVGLLTMACSGRYGVGFEPTPDGAAGQGDGSGGTTTDVPVGDNSASGGTVTSAGGTDIGGSSFVGAGGDGVAATAPRCGFAPETTSVVTTPTASTEIVAARIARFLDDSDSLELPVNLPPQANAAWASAQATAVLDEHLAQHTEAAGLVRFLTGWLKIGGRQPELSTAHTWSLKLLEPTATLSTLLAEPTGEPHRLGILTDSELLQARTGIPQRGAWMMSQLFCTPVPPPPPGVPMLDPSAASGVTRREKLESVLVAPSCNACHDAMDPAGYSLEHFDAMGSYREQDNGEAVDAAATIMPAMLSFDDFDALAPQLAQSCDVAQCFAKAVMTDAYGPESTTAPTFTEQESNHVANVFADSGFSIRALVRAVVTTPSFLR
jgi:hypothetical protein